MAQHFSWGHININVSNLDASIAFYKKLGFTIFVPGVPYLNLNIEASAEIPSAAGQALGLAEGTKGRACIMQLYESFPKIVLTEFTGQLQIEISGLVEPVSAEGKRICQEDINDVVAAFVQDPQTAEQGMFREDTPPEELTIVKMGRIVAEKYPGLEEEDKEAIRKRAVAAINIVQQAKAHIQKDKDDDAPTPNTALIDGVRKLAMDVRDLDIDLIDSINPFGNAYAIMGKTVSEESLRDIAAYITGKKVHMTRDEAQMLAKRALQFKRENGRLPSITSNDP